MCGTVQCTNWKSEMEPWPPASSVSYSLLLFRTHVARILIACSAFGCCRLRTWRAWQRTRLRRCLLHYFVSNSSMVAKWNNSRSKKYVSGAFRRKTASGTQTNLMESMFDEAWKAIISNLFNISLVFFLMGGGMRTLSSVALWQKKLRKRRLGASAVPRSQRTPARTASILTCISKIDTEMGHVFGWIWTEIRCSSYYLCRSRTAKYCFIKTIVRVSISPLPYDFRQSWSWKTKGKRNKERCAREIRTR